MQFFRAKLFLPLSAAALFLGACSSGGSSSGSGSAIRTITIGAIYSATGGGAVPYGQSIKFEEARINKANATNEVPGVRFKIIGEDDTSTDAGALAAAQDLVESKHVFGIIDSSEFAAGAYRYLVQNNVPDVGGGYDGNEYADPTNTTLFSPRWSVDNNCHAVTTWGSFVKSQGVTKLAVVAYGNVPTAVCEAKVVAAGAQQEGVPVAYENLTIPAGSVDFTAVALAIKNSGADGVVGNMSFPSNTGLFSALQAAGVTMKVELAGSGYGQDTLGESAVVAANQGIDVALPEVAPAELHDPATVAFEKDLKKYAGFTGDPTVPADDGWIPADLFITGVKLGGGKNVTQKSFVTKLRKDKDYNPYGGLLGPHGLNMDQFGGGANSLLPGNCVYIVKLLGDNFHLISGAEPICGTVIPNSNQV